jgi:hypothetical protein
MTESPHCRIVNWPAKLEARPLPQQRTCRSVNLELARDRRGFDIWINQLSAVSAADPAGSQRPGHLRAEIIEFCSDAKK